ncbi:MAG: HEAT repeat domain-containing protein [Chloroflexota bacterium]|nr:HEAT repeat domain-containing protein [Chloroflexota bacterium]
MSTEKKLLAYHLGRLIDKNAEVRLRSIEELVALGDMEALPTLEALFRNDLDENVRKAAQEAGRAIFVKSQKR